MHEVDGGDGVATLDLPEWSRLLQLARQAERSTGMDGLSSFLLAKAKQVSDAVPTVIHGGTLGAQTFDAHRRDHALAQYFSANPWWPGPRAEEPVEGHRTPEASELERAAKNSRWAFLGGWFGLPPTIALATADGSARRHDPAYVFLPPFAVAYATDLVARLVGGTEPTWSEVWDRWRAIMPPVGYPPTRRNDTLVDSLARSARRGADPAIVGQRVSAAAYPGFDALARKLKTAELRLV
jgi:hypothetical protein